MSCKRHRAMGYIHDCADCRGERAESKSASVAGSTDRILKYIKMRKEQTEDYIGVEVLAGNEVKRLIEVAVLAELEALERFIETGQ